MYSHLSKAPLRILLFLSLVAVAAIPSILGKAADAEPVIEVNAVTAGQCELLGGPGSGICAGTNLCPEECVDIICAGDLCSFQTSIACVVCPFPDPDGDPFDRTQDP